MKLTDAIKIIAESKCSKEQEEMMKKYHEFEEEALKQKHKDEKVMMKQKHKDEKAEMHHPDTEEAECDVKVIFHCVEKIADALEDMEKIDPKVCDKLAKVATMLCDVCEMMGCEVDEDEAEEDEGCSKY